MAVLAAKLFLTADVLSGGRLILGAGGSLTLDAARLDLSREAGEVLCVRLEYLAQDRAVGQPVEPLSHPLIPPARGVCQTARC